MEEKDKSVNQTDSKAISQIHYDEHYTVLDQHEKEQDKRQKDKLHSSIAADEHKGKRLTNEKEKQVVHALVDQLMGLMENSTKLNERDEKASKKAMIWPNKMIPWLKKMLMNKLYGNGAGTDSNDGVGDVGRFSPGISPYTNGDSELPTGLIQGNANQLQNEFPDNYDGFMPKSTPHHRYHNLKTFPLLKMLKNRLNGGNVGVNGAPNFVAKQLLNQVLGGAPDRGAVIREMMQEFSLSNGNDRDATEAREAYNELLGRNNLVAPQPGFGPGITSLAQEKPANMFPGMSTQQMQNTFLESEQPMAFGGGRGGVGVGVGVGQQVPNLLARETQARLAQQAGLPRPLMQKIMAEGDTLEELKDPSALRSEAMLSNAQSQMGSARAAELQLERAQTQLGQARAQLQQTPRPNTNQFVNNQPVIQATLAQNELPLYHDFRLNQNQLSPFLRSTAQLGLRNSGLMENYNGDEKSLERAEVNRLLRLGPNFSAWPKGFEGRLPEGLGTNQESLAQQRSFNPRLPETAAGAHNALKYLNPENALRSQAQLGPVSPRLPGALSQLRSRGPLGLPESRLQSIVDNRRLRLQLAAASRLNTPKISEGRLDALNRRGNLPEKNSSTKSKPKDADALVLKEKMERRSIEYFRVVQQN